MKNSKGFTLIELIAVVVILGVIMLIAVPNILATLEKNKKETFLKDAQLLVSAAEYKLSSDTSVPEPDTYNIIIFKLSDLPTAALSESPYGTNYSQSKSFVAVVKNRTDSGTAFQRQFYVHLLACVDPDCDVESDENRAINLSLIGDLNTSRRFDKVVQGQEVRRAMIDEATSIKQIVGKANSAPIVFYGSAS